MGEKMVTMGEPRKGVFLAIEVLKSQFPEFSNKEMSVV